MPAASPLWCLVRPCPPSPRTWTSTATACLLECVLALLPSTSLPWSLYGCSQWPWCVATPIYWSRRSGCQPVPCCWSRCCRMPVLQMGHSMLSTANTMVRGGLCYLEQMIVGTHCLMYQYATQWLLFIMPPHWQKPSQETLHFSVIYPSHSFEHSISRCVFSRFWWPKVGYLKLTHNYNCIFCHSGEFHLWPSRHQGHQLCGLKSSWGVYLREGL